MQGATSKPRQSCSPPVRFEGLIHIGLNHFPAGRAGESSAERLSDCMRDFGFEVGRLKTGTPPRLDRDSIDFLSWNCSRVMNHHLHSRIALRRFLYGKSRVI